MNKEVLMNNPFIETMLSRRSVKSFTDALISEEDLNTILTCGQYAPTGTGQQNYRLVAIRDRAVIDEMIAIHNTVSSKPGDPFYGAPTVVVVFETDASATPVQNASCIIDHMLLAAHGLNIGGCWINGVVGIFQTEAGKALQKRLGVSEEYFAVGSAALGESAAPKRTPNERENTIIRIG